MPRTGRRPGQSGSRERILAAARAQFAKHGYDRATIRAIAQTARVDPALVLHYFGSKHEVFVAAMRLPLDPSRLIPELLAPGVDGLGSRLVRRFIEIWDSPEGAHLVGFVRSVVSHEAAAAMMREFFTHMFLEPVAAALEVDQPRRRAALVASQLFGLALARYVVKIGPLASASAQELARWIGPALQLYLTGDLPGPGRIGSVGKSAEAGQAR